MHPPTLRGLPLTRRRAGSAHTRTEQTRAQTHAKLSPGRDADHLLPIGSAVALVTTIPERFQTYHVNLPSGTSPRGGPPRTGTHRAARPHADPHDSENIRRAASESEPRTGNGEEGDGSRRQTRRPPTGRAPRTTVSPLSQTPLLL